MFLRAIPLENVENSKIFCFKRLYVSTVTNDIILMWYEYFI